MSLARKHWLYAAVAVVSFCILLGAFLAWRASQPVETKTVYALPEPNPKRAELLKRVKLPPRRVNTTLAWNTVKERTLTGIDISPASDPPLRC